MANVFIQTLQIIYRRLELKIKLKKINIKLMKTL